ncbi:MAG: PAS domain-containing protein [Cyclobacteriaceae bacterium]
MDSTDKLNDPPESRGNADLIKLENRLRNALSGAKMALWEFDLTNNTVRSTGKVSDYFDEFSRSFDGTVDSYYELVHPDDKPEVNHFIQNSILKGKSFFNHHRVKWPDGTFHWIEGTGDVIKSDGSVVMTGTIQDITEKKELELEREDWKTKYELVAQSAGAIIYDYDIPSGKIIWSGDIVTVLGYTSGEMGDIDTWGDLIHPDDKEMAFELLDKAQESLKSYDVQYRFRRKDQTFCYIHDRGFFTNLDGKAKRMIGMMNDITKRMEDQNALAESENRFKEVIKNLNVGVAMFDLKGKPFLYNAAAYELFGLTIEQWQGTSHLPDSWNVIHEDGKLYQVEEYPIVRTLYTGNAVSDELMGVLPEENRERVWILVNSIPIFNNSGDLLYGLCTYTDISRSQRAQEKLTEKNNQLVQLTNELKLRNDQLLEFAQIVSHNLRSPMSNLSSLLDIHKNIPNAEKEEVVSQMEETVNSALQTVSDLNDILKIRQGEKLQFQRILFKETLSKVKIQLSRTLIEKQANITEDFTVDKIVVPRVYLESILLNLLSNSLKYSKPNKPVSIKTSTHIDENRTILKFKDNGIGIDLKKHGNKLFKYGKTFHSNKEKRGVGLFLIKNQIEIIGGEIEVKSKPEKGTTFIIKFPLKQEDA